MQFFLSVGPKVKKHHLRSVGERHWNSIRNPKPAPQEPEEPERTKERVEDKLNVLWSRSLPSTLWLCETGGEKFERHSQQWIILRERESQARRTRKKKTKRCNILIKRTRNTNLSELHCFVLFFLMEKSTCLNIPFLWMALNLEKKSDC